LPVLLSFFLYILSFKLNFQLVDYDSLVQIKQMISQLNADRVSGFQLNKLRHIQLKLAQTLPGFKLQTLLLQKV